MSRSRRPFLRLSIALLAAAALPAVAQDACKHRGDLDSQYCDDDGDLVANLPKDSSRWKNPDTILYANSPLEDPAVHEKLMQPFMQYMQQCSGKKFRYYTVLSNAAAVEAMRSGRMHMGNFSTGDTAFAVNLAGAVPIAVRGDGNGPQGMHLIAIVKASSPFHKLTDLKGRKLAHVAPSSNSGNLAPRALFAREGMVADRDYVPLYSGKHENSIAGVASGDYDGAAVADDILQRMAVRGLVRVEDFRVLYRSPAFLPGALSLAHDLHPDLQRKLKDCTYAYRFTPDMKAAFANADRYVPITYKQDWANVRAVAEANGIHYTRSAFEAEQKKAAEKAKK